MWEYESLTEYKRADWIKHQLVNTMPVSVMGLLCQIGETSGWTK